MKFNYKDTCLLSEKAIAMAGTRIIPEIERVRSVLKEGYDTDYASVNLPFDDGLLKSVLSVSRQKKKYNPKAIIVIGIGGSNLGTISIQEAVKGRLYNDLEPKVKVYFADTVDADKTSDLLKICDNILKAGNNILVNVVTKSGRTTETISLFECFVKLLKKHKKSGYNKYVIATTDKGSKLWDYAVKEDYSLLEIPKKVGGRFSVFSPVGLLPLSIIGLDIMKLRDAAAKMVKKCVQTDVMKNPAAISAIITYLQNKKGKNINDLFLFSTDLESIGKWYRQLMGESIGKQWDKNHSKKIYAGITPTVSIGSVDLHSMAQLYLGGPRDKYTTFVRVRNNKSNMRIPSYNAYELFVENIQGRQMSELMDAILEGTQIAFKKGKRPYSEIELPDKSEASIGQLLQFKMLEMIYLGSLMGVNTFDQPNVEEYKKETREILSK